MPMLPKHRAQLDAVIARFQADIQRLARAVRSQERDRLLTTFDPGRARSAAVATAGTRKRAAAATGKQPAARTRPAAAGTRARQGVTKRTRKPDAARTRGEPAGAGSAVATAATTRPAATETSTENMVMDRAGMDAATGARAEPSAQETSSPPAAGDPSSPGTTDTRAPAAGDGTGAGPTWVRGGKRVRWTRESIINELARWMVTGTAIDSSFLKRHGPPGLVTAALRIFGRFDAALNVAGLQVAKLYPDGPPAR